MAILVNLSNRMIIEDSLCCDCSDVQVSNCDLSRVSVENSKWMSNSINNSNAPNVEFISSRLEDVTLYRSNFEKSKYIDSVFYQVTFSGLTLIKSEWNSVKMRNFTLKHCTMQRASIEKCIVEDSIFSDFEALDADVCDCFFKNCKFELTDDAGMNGFSSANIRSSIFYNCSFSGYPLRGSNVLSCVFINPTGFIADDIEINNTVGLESVMRSNVKEKTLSNIDSAKKFIQEWNK